MKFESIVTTYSKLAYKVAIDILSSPEEAQDIVQESYLSLYSHFNEYKKLSDNEIKNVLCKIVLNKCRDYLKSSKRREITVFDNVSNIEEFNLYDDSIDNVIEEDSKNYIESEISNLKEPYNEILKLYYIDEKSLDEISEIRNTSKGTIKVQITRGKQYLKEKLGKERIG